MVRLGAWVLVLLLAACSTPAGFHDAGQRDAALASFRSGRAALSCGNGLDCAVKWATTRTAAENFAKLEQWDNLAETVLATGYDNDLCWFYLGLAAQGMRYNGAARIYYETSVRRTTAGGLNTCVSETFSLCGPVNLPGDANRMMAELRSATPISADTSTPAPKVTRAPDKAAPRADTAAGSDWQTPQATPGQASSQWVDPGAAAKPSQSGGGDWVSPKPAAQ